MTTACVYWAGPAPGPEVALRVDLSRHLVGTRAAPAFEIETPTAEEPFVVGRSPFVRAVLDTSLGAGAGGAVYEGVGIPVDIEVPYEPEALAAGDPVLEAALDLLSSARRGGTGAGG